jgi:hypothetical protein
MFSVRTETNRNSICFGCFSVCSQKSKNFFSVFRISIETTETNRIFSKQTEKISKKRSLFRGPRNRNFFSRFEPKQTETRSVSAVVFRFAFSQNPKKYFSVCFDVSDRYRKKQNLWYGELKRLIF